MGMPTEERAGMAKDGKSELSKEEKRAQKEAKLAAMSPEERARKEAKRAEKKAAKAGGA